MSKIKSINPLAPGLVLKAVGRDSFVTKVYADQSHWGTRTVQLIRQMPGVGEVYWEALGRWSGGDMDYKITTIKASTLESETNYEAVGIEALPDLSWRDPESLHEGLVLVDLTLLTRGIFLAVRLDKRTESAHTGAPQWTITKSCSPELAWWQTHRIIAMKCERLCNRLMFSRYDRFTPDEWTNLRDTRTKPGRV